MAFMSNIKIYLAEDPSKRLGKIEWYRGDSFPIPLIVEKSGQPMDLTGCKFILTVSPVSNPADETQHSFQAVGVVVPGQDTVPGRLYFVPSPEDTDLESKRYFFEIQMLDSDGYVRTVASEDWTILQDMTKRTAIGWDAVPNWDDVPDWDQMPGQ